MPVPNYDVKQEFPQLYRPRAGVVTTVEVPAFDTLQIDGHGDPNTSATYAEAVRTLFTVSYAVRAIVKRELGRTHTVGPLEGLWSADDPSAFTRRDKSAWDWTMMIVQPDWITAATVEAAIGVAATKGADALDRLRFTGFDEGLSVQVLHRGSFDDEGPVLEHLHGTVMPDNGFTWNGRHHEIYLSDPRRTESARLRTILRQPVRPIT